MGFWSTFGLMTVAEHDRLSDNRVERLNNSLESKEATIERLVGERDNAIDKYSDLASKYNDVVEENIALRPDAEAMRAKRKRDVEQKADKRKAAAAPAPKPVAAKVKRGTGK